ncbi:GNAT family N-acetyltransferase [Kocuria flava]|uniref:GNAT family N-acetyltransferase n=1 Tax=Kocuria flava TaxID=446860 RepID=UPI001FF13890|nr:GNAT family N-acetyltransferase [Kocuria flava]MCJ8503440.1 GNAT family N-acetyltransferase [Kocuria flava]
MSQIREARPQDVPAVLAMVRELAEYEREPDAVRMSEEQLAEALFGAHPAVFAHVVDDGERLLGFALWFRTFSTWEGVHGIHLEDLYVRPEARGAGHGKELLRSLARHAVDRGWARVEWSVLNWNEPSIGFYRSLGALPQDEWSVFRLTGDALREAGAAREHEPGRA